MNRRTLLGRLASLRKSDAPRPDYFRPLHEQLEERKLLSVVNWTIDSSQSALTVTIPDQTFTIAVNSSTTLPVTFHTGNQNQTNDSTSAWTVGNAAAVSGTLATDYVDGTSIQFLTGQGSATGITNPTTNFYPDPGTASANPGFGDANSGTANYPVLHSNYIYDLGNRSDGRGSPSANHTSPTNGFQSLSTTAGVFAWRTHAVTLGGLASADTAYFNIREALYDESSGLLPISGGNFTPSSMFVKANSTDAGDAGAYELDVPLSGQLPDYVNKIQNFLLLGGTNTAATATVTTPDAVGHPLVRQLTVPFVGQFVFPIGGFTFTGTVAGQEVATATLSPETVDLNGAAAGTGFTSMWSNAGPVNITDPTATVVPGGTTSMTLTLANPQPGDVLAANTAGTGITASWNGTNTLTLTGNGVISNGPPPAAADVSGYQTVLRTVTYNNTIGPPGPASETVNIQAVDPASPGGPLNSNVAVATINLPVAFNSSVVNRSLFYKGSSRYDGTGGPREPLPFSDDNAIATDKSAYLPGSGATTFANVSSYTLGINGLMVDLSGTHGTIAASDFTFKTGNNNSPSSWTTVVAAATVTTRPGAGTSGSDRIEITFPNNAIQKTWLEVIVKGNDTLGSSDTNTGLAASNVFFWGNALADDGTLPDDSGAYRTTATDELDARNNPKTLLNNIPITNAQDYNRDGLVSATDQLASRNNPTTNLSGPHILNIAGGGPFAPDAGASAAPAASSASSSAGPSGLSLSSSLPSSLPPWLQSRLQNVLDSAPVVRILHSLEQANTPTARQILQTIDAIADKYNLHDDVLDGILVDLGLESPAV